MAEYESYWLEKGTILNEKYKIVDVIEEGGMGIVYRGYDLVLDIAISIKEYFPRRFATRDRKETNIHIYKGDAERHFAAGLHKFVSEARMLAQFEQMDSIVLVKDFFHANNTAYIIMEYVPGDNAKQRVAKEGPLEPAYVLDVMKPILLSLDTIHQTGLLHRDISPDNIVFRENGRAVLIDFGAARILDTNETKTMTVFFKRGYSAEEQYVEKAAKGAYTDVYAICATMYFMLTGEAPNESVARLVRDTVVPLTKHKNIDLSMAAKEAIMKGMSVHAKDRYQTVSKLCHALYGKTERKSQTKRAGIILGVLVLFAGLGVWGGMATGSRENQGKHEALVTSQPAVETLAVDESLSEDAMPEGTAIPKPNKSELSVAQYIMLDVTGMKEKKARKRLQKNGDTELKVVAKEVYSSRVAKGRVVSQSVAGGTMYTPKEVTKITLRISKGPKPKRNIEAENQSAERTEQETSKKAQEEDYAGHLPW